MSTQLELHPAISKYDTRDRCPFWTTNYSAMGYCRFNNERCHASTACQRMNGDVDCKTFKALMMLSALIPFSTDIFLLFPKGENVK